jgi:hypothetical protein
MMVEYLVEAVWEVDMETGHHVPVVRVTCRKCGASESEPGAGMSAESRARARLEDHRHHKSGLGGR